MVSYYSVVAFSVEAYSGLGPPVLEAGVKARNATFVTPEEMRRRAEYTAILLGAGSSPYSSIR
jgi:hypothetical protein